MEEELSLPLRPRIRSKFIIHQLTYLILISGDDSRSRMAQFDGPVVARRDKVSFFV